MIEEMLSTSFVQRALLAGALASVSAGVVGAMVVVRRSVFLAGGVSHAAFGGIGLALWLSAKLSAQVDPFVVAIAFGLLIAGLLALLSSWGRERLDAAMGMLWPVGMAVGVMFVNATPGRVPHIESYLFGNVLSVTSDELLVIGVFDVITLAVVISFYRGFVALLIDKELAIVAGAPVRRLDFALLALMSVTAIILIKVVGVILVLALLTFPAALAGRLTKTLGGMMALAAVLAFVFVTAGVTISYESDAPPGATIALLAAGAYGLVLAATRVARLRGSRAATATATSIDGAR